MKKLIVITFIVLIIGFLLALSKKDDDYLLDYFSKDEIKYIEENNITYQDLHPFLKFTSFDVYKYYSYQAYLSTGSNYYEALNLVNDSFFYSGYTSTKMAPYQDTFYTLVNKHLYLEESFIPQNLSNLSIYAINYIKRTDEVMQANTTALMALEEMAIQASIEGIELIVYSAYRSYQKQEYLYYVVNSENDFYSARPGHSEHQTGLVFDISDSIHGLTENFKYSSSYTWLLENSYKYGFILRYPKSKEDKTLFKYEPWHFRYVTKSIATYMHNNDLCLEEYILKNYELILP